VPQSAGRSPIQPSNPFAPRLQPHGRPPVTSSPRQLSCSIRSSAPSEYGSGGQVAHGTARADRGQDQVPAGLEHHQAEFIASAREGHRSYLLADEPDWKDRAGAASPRRSRGESYPLVVVPNAVKMNWAREVESLDLAAVGHGSSDSPW
jgi:hypothetical protein